MTEQRKLTKVVVDLPHHWATGGEGIWAFDLGDDTYQLDNVPFHAYDLNYGDVVKATSERPEWKPQVRAVLRRSGHQTLRVSFEDSVPEERMLGLLRSLASLSVSFERATDRYFALDLEPSADMQAVRRQLDEWEAAGLLDYETCEARVPGSFDDSPAEEHS